jgi:hypothetical protein
MAVTANDVLLRAQYLLNDAGVRWSVDELMRWLNEGQAAAVRLDPTIYSFTESFTCVAGAKQTLPADVYILLDVPRNLTPRTKAIRSVMRAELDVENPDWYGMTRSDSAAHYTYEKSYDNTFYLYPPVLAGVTIEYVVAKAPPHIDEWEVISIGDIYSEALVNYICYRANMKETSAAAATRATEYYQLFIGAFIAKGPMADAASARGGN